MDPRHHLPLMFAVLDSEATPEEVRELERLIAIDAGARAEYEAQRRFFARLQRVFLLDPPSGLADAAAKRLQPFNLSAKGETMIRKVSKRALWIGTGVAASAVLIAGFLLKFPPAGENAVGTVAPAQRYRAEQIKAGDVKLGDQTVAQLMQSDSFERIVRDPKMRALAQDPAFEALARSEALAAILRNADALVAQAKSANADALVARAKSVNADALVAQAKSLNADALVAQAKSVEAQKSADALVAQAKAFNADALAAQAKSVEAQKSDALVAQAKAFNADALVAQAKSVEAMMTPQAWQLLGKYTEAITLMAHDPGLVALATNPAFANALAANAASVNAVSK
jgi:hypothetical protein